MYILILICLVIITNCKNDEKKARFETKKEIESIDSILYNMDIYYLPVRMITYFPITTENIEENSTIKLHLKKNDACFISIMEQLNVKNYKSNYEAFGKNSIRIKIRIRNDVDTITYLVDCSGAIYFKGRSFTIRNIDKLEEIINNCNVN